MRDSWEFAAGTGEESGVGSGVGAVGGCFVVGSGSGGVGDAGLGSPLGEAVWPAVGAGADGFAGTASASELGVGLGVGVGQGGTRSSH